MSLTYSTIVAHPVVAGAYLHCNHCFRLPASDCPGTLSTLCDATGCIFSVGTYCKHTYNHTYHFVRCIAVCYFASKRWACAWCDSLSVCFTVSGTSRLCGCSLPSCCNRLPHGWPVALTLSSFGSSQQCCGRSAPSNRGSQARTAVKLIVGAVGLLSALMPAGGTLQCVAVSALRAWACCCL